MVVFDNVFETKENKIQIMIKLNLNINTCKISGASFSVKKKKLSLSMKITYVMFSSHIKRLTLLWLYTRSHL